MTADLQELMAKLAERLQLVEDTLAYHRAISSYGPLVDGNDPEVTAPLWANVGLYDCDGGTPTDEDPPLREAWLGMCARPRST